MRTSSIIKEPEYNLTKGEVRFKIFMNRDDANFVSNREKIKENGGYCLSAKNKMPDTRCMCKDFLLLDKEDTLCKCGLYFKKERTKTEIKKFITAKKVFSTKNENKILTEDIPSENEENFMDTNGDDE